ncbi:hypothetical protein PMI31_00798 [Pseudomonas sp. GM55]|nr:hypothetical protein PMI31_00798 [Pseudomonas sp. GM55]
MRGLPGFFMDLKKLQVRRLLSDSFLMCCWVSNGSTKTLPSGFRKLLLYGCKAQELKSMDW